MPSKRNATKQGKLRKAKAPVKKAGTPKRALRTRGRRPGSRDATTVPKKAPGSRSAKLKTLKKASVAKPPADIVSKPRSSRKRLKPGKAIVVDEPPKVSVTRKRRAPKKPRKALSGTKATIPPTRKRRGTMTVAAPAKSPEPKAPAQPQLGKPAHKGGSRRILPRAPKFRRPTRKKTPSTQQPTTVTAELPPPATPRELAEEPIGRRHDSAAPPTTVQPRGFVTRSLEELPSILLEGDEPASPPIPFRAPAPVRRQPAWSRESLPETDSLPEAYGTGKLFLLARDPDCVYAHWDLPPEQQQRYNHLSGDRHLVLRVFAREKSGQPFREIHLHPESQSWFVYVDRIAHVYVAELGYYAPGGTWVSIADSDPVSTPPEGPAAEKSVQFAMLAPAPTHPRGIAATDGPTSQQSPALPTPAPALVMVHSVPSMLSRSEPPVGQAQTPVHSHPAVPTQQALPSLTILGHVATEHKPAEPTGTSTGVGAPTLHLQVLPEALLEEIHWTESLDRSLEEIVTTGRTWNARSSMEHVETSRRVLEQELASLAAARKLRVQVLPGHVSSLPPEESAAGEKAPAVSSQFEQVPPEQVPPSERKFWFMVNAELVIYGATEPTATVTIGERRIRLRPDGTFSYRFSLPDGQYQLPVEAVSVDDDHRFVTLNFSRSSATHGEVGKHPQDPALRPPKAEHVS